MSTLPHAAQACHHREARLVGILLVGGSLIGLLGIVVRAALETRPPGFVERTPDPVARR